MFPSTKELQHGIAEERSDKEGRLQTRLIGALLMWGCTASHLNVYDRDSYPAVVVVFQGCHFHNAAKLLTVCFQR